MSNKILVTYASRTGATAGAAEAIGAVLAENGEQVDIRAMKDVTDLTPYHAVVLGSAIQGAQWLPEAAQFVRTHQSALAKKRCAIFTVCMTLAMKNKKYHSVVNDWVAPIRAQTKPVSEGYFAGVLELRKVPSLRKRFGFWLSIVFGVWTAGDHRDWDAIKSWAANLQPMLKA